MLGLFKKKKKQQTPIPQYPYRMLFIRKGCVHCLLYYGVIEEFNMYLRPDKRIKIIDVTDEWEFNVNLEPVSQYVELKGTPTLYLGGMVLEGVSTKSYIKGFLKGYLERMGDL